MKIKQSISHLDEVLKRKKDLSIIECIREGFGIWKMDWSTYLAFVVIMMFINLILTNIPYLGKVLNVVLFTPAFTLGGAYVAHRIYLNKDGNFKLFFGGFKSSWSILLSKS